MEGSVSQSFFYQIREVNSLKKKLISFWNASVNELRSCVAEISLNRNGPEKVGTALLPVRGKCFLSIRYLRFHLARGSGWPRTLDCRVISHLPSPLRLCCELPHFLSRFSWRTSPSFLPFIPGLLPVSTHQIVGSPSDYIPGRNGHQSTLPISCFRKIVWRQEAVKRHSGLPCGFLDSGKSLGCSHLVTIEAVSWESGTNKRMSLIAHSHLLGAWLAQTNAWIPRRHTACGRVTV